MRWVGVIRNRQVDIAERLARIRGRKSSILQTKYVAWRHDQNIRGKAKNTMRGWDFSVVENLTPGWNSVCHLASQDVSFSFMSLFGRQRGQVTTGLFFNGRLDWTEPWNVAKVAQNKRTAESEMPWTTQVLFVIYLRQNLRELSQVSPKTMLKISKQ